MFASGLPHPRLSLLLLAAAVSLLGSCKSPEPVGDIEMPEPVVERKDDIGTQGYKTSIGDALDLFVLEDSSFNGEFIIRPSGDIILPKAGRVQVVNMSLSEVEATVKGILEKTQLRQATVIADPKRRGAGTGGEGQVAAGLTIYVTGNVVRTGRQMIPFVGGGRVTAYQAVMDAGGFAPFANKKKSYVLRRDEHSNTHRIPVNFEKIEESKEPDLRLQDGDMLVVPQKFIGI